MLMHKTKQVEARLTNNPPEIFSVGWRHIICLDLNAELVPPYEHALFKYITIKFHNVEAAVLSFYINDAIQGGELVVDMAYVDPGYHKKGLYKLLHKLVLKYAKCNKIKIVSMTVRKNNHIMNTIQEKLGGDPQYVTYEYRP